ncbi:hypothetical protein IAQ61_009602 [Plenodomus lingam]|uniref:uncharacterized protein n=1 Tax=Leptosphaeria maculans TaxID=5022 RepID=UPI00332CED72|nr:hypothetical protein IAQ61_009602 [Plenodomus lingam]
MENLSTYRCWIQHNYCRVALAILIIFCSVATPSDGTIATTWPKHVKNPSPPSPFSPTILSRQPWLECDTC